MVQIVMPLGGTESGLFRFPRVGETVLVGTEEEAHYLMGYMPSEDAHFSTGNAAQTKAQVFRYNNNGVNFSDSPYSEIAFNSTTGKVEGAAIPIDSINIKSTGNILHSAGNNLSLQADSLNIGIGADKGNAVISADSAGNITIEAASSITLKVGRTTLNISDTSFSVKSQIADTPIANTWDAALSLSPRGGFSASGMNCKISAAKKAAMSDSMGGLFSTQMGVGQVKGRELKMATYNAKEYAILTITEDIDFTENMIALINAMEYQDKLRELKKNAVDQKDRAAAATAAASEASAKVAAAAAAYTKAQKAQGDFKEGGSPASGPLKEALDTAIKAAKEAEQERHTAAEKAKKQQDLASERQNALDTVTKWGSIFNMVMEWVRFVKELTEKLLDLIEEQKRLSIKWEQAREMERKARLANVNLKDPAKEAVEAAAKEKAIEAYKAGNPGASDEDAEKYWEDMSKEDKDTRIAQEREAGRAEVDKRYQETLKEEAEAKAAQDIAKEKYDALPADPNRATPTWENLSSAEKSQYISQVTPEEKEQRGKDYIDELEGQKEQQWKTGGIYEFGGAQKL
jgi:hypothetical protein